MKIKHILIILISFLILGVDSCPTEPEENTDTIGEPPAFPDIPTDD